MCWWTCIRGTDGALSRSGGERWPWRCALRGLTRARQDLLLRAITAGGLVLAANLAEDEALEAQFAGRGWSRGSPAGA